MTDNKSKKDPLFIRTVKLSNKSLNKINKTVSRLNAEFERLKRRNTTEVSR